jgi:CHAD domain-containing protein
VKTALKLVQVNSKAPERHHAPEAVAVKVAKAALPTADMSPAAALKLIMAGCRSDIHQHRAAVLASDDPAGIHQVRVALRRLRAAIELFRGVVEKPELQSINVEARRLAGACGPVRDLQVFLSETAPDAPPRIARIGNNLTFRRLSHARAVLGGTRFARFDARLKQFTAGPETGGEALGAFAQRVFDKCEAKVRRRGHGLSKLTALELHRLRIATKKLRYATDFLAPIFKSPEADAYVDATVSLQDALGTLNDRTMSKHVLADIAKAGRSSDGVGRSCKRLARRLKAPSKRDRRHLKQAWKTFKQAESFWR